ncbi:MAG TPA: exopolysaccharide biosynthesis polyprenyl glycosylphosphotransferase [Solirubrobacteraceae bacterium]|nr:exopolysaccharide biosynthesis polyprenyl glycosylphosphotransferase [Solirubrobacteraceae bacterium]
MPLLDVDPANYDQPVARHASRDLIRRWSLAVADTVAGAGAIAVTHALSGPRQPEALTVLAAPLIVVLAKFMGLYESETRLVRRSTLDEAPSLFQLATLYSISIWLINGAAFNTFASRREFLILWPATLATLLGSRAIARALRRRLLAPERCLVIGDDVACERVRAKLARTPSLHASVVAQVRLADGGEDRCTVADLRDRRDLRALVEALDVDRMIVAPTGGDTERTLDLIRAGNAVGIKVSVAPRVLEVVGPSAEFDELEGLPLLSMRRVELRPSSRAIKRTIDVLGSLLALVLLSPVLLAIAIAIRLDSDGPAIYRQQRVGRGGRAFEMLKFRTMAPGSHERREELRHLSVCDELFKIDRDPRVTRVGRWLRLLSLDELPQLLNVLRGDMSLVGPRPLVLEEDQRIRGWHRRRLHLTPGMTGNWQILGSARVPLEEMVKIDYLYVTNWSLWQDCKILLRTVAYVAARRGM